MSQPSEPRPLSKSQKEVIEHMRETHGDEWCYCGGIKRITLRSLNKRGLLEFRRTSVNEYRLKEKNR